MNKRLERIKAEEASGKKRQKGASRRVLMSMLVCIGIFAFGTTAQHLTKASEAEKTPTQDLPPQDNFVVDGATDWRLLIVSPASVLDRAFTVSLYELEGKKVDVRIARSLMEMLADARAEGVELTLCSTYRSVNTQRGIYERKVTSYKSLGYAEERAMELAGRYVQPPGASEHHTGLAVDFFNGDDATLTEEFAKTTAYAWLQENAGEYGFVERYEEEKEEITGIGWEPWHYRYVGKHHAEAMTAGGLCLEEYTAQSTNSER